MNASLPTPALPGSGSGYHLSHVVVNRIYATVYFTFWHPQKSIFASFTLTYIQACVAHLGQRYTIKWYAAPFTFVYIPCIRNSNTNSILGRSVRKRDWPQRFFCGGFCFPLHYTWHWNLHKRRVGVFSLVSNSSLLRLDKMFHRVQRLLRCNPKLSMCLCFLRNLICVVK